MKLGFKILYTSTTIQDGPVFNGDEALNKYAGDVRPFIQKVFPTKEELEKVDADPDTSFEESSKIVYLLQLIGHEGYMFTIIKANPEDKDQPFENTALWIHVPLNVYIGKSEFHRLLNELRDILSADDKTNVSKLKKIANRDYSENNYLVQSLTSNFESEDVGVFLYGNDTNYNFEEILGPEIHQPGFTKYRALFFVDNSLGLALNKDVLAYVNVEEIIKLVNPEECDGFKPYIGKQLFDKPIEIADGSHLTITWRQEGYIDITKEVEVNEYTNLNDYKPKEDEEFYVFYKKWYIVRADHSDRLLQKAKVEINGQTFTSDTLLMNHSCLRYGYDLKVNYPGYDEYFAVMPLKGRPLPMEIRLVRDVHTYEFTISAYDDKGKRLDEEITAVLKTPETITKCPIKGYGLGKDDTEVTEGAFFHLSYNTLKEKIIYFALGAAVVALIWIICSLFGGRSHKRESVQIGNTTPTTTVVEKAQVVIKPDTTTVEKMDSIQQIIESENPTTEEKAEP